MANGRSANRRPFTAELQRMQSASGTTPAPTPASGGGDEGGGGEVMGAIRELREDLRVLKNVVLRERRNNGDGDGAPGMSQEERERLETELAEWRSRIETQKREADQLRSELKEMMDHIDQTKKEIVALRPSDQSQDRISTVTHELDAIVNATESATETILDSAERIDTMAQTIKAQEGDEFLAHQAEEISEQVVAIFEASNFQDLTGQRITKVVSTLKFIEDRVTNMMEIWGSDAFEGVEADLQEKTGDEAMLQGPSDDATSIGQGEIDKLFD